MSPAAPIGPANPGSSGANERDRHYRNVNIERDASVKAYADLRIIQEGDPSPDGKGTIRFAEGIEVGQVFKLGTRYSEAMNATYLGINLNVAGSCRQLIRLKFLRIDRLFPEASLRQHPPKSALTFRWR